MAQLAIKGHSTRGSEVISLLKMLGGKEKTMYHGSEQSWVYTINKEGFIATDLDCFCDRYAIYSLEEFLEKFPYKVGDKVYYDNKSCDVIEMLWNSNLNTISYGVYDGKIKNLTLVEDLKPYPYKEETMESNPILQQLKEYFDNTPRDVIEKEWHEYDKYNKIGPTVNEYLEYVNKSRQPQYPKTYEKCYKIVYPNSKDVKSTSVNGHYWNSLQKLSHLLLCRDAYWKIAGEQMGLGKPWKPDWLNTEQDKFVIYTHNNVIHLNFFLLGHNVLAFPTEEMRNAFFENFKDLIEDCKELL